MVGDLEAEIRTEVELCAGFQFLEDKACGQLDAVAYGAVVHPEQGRILIPAAYRNMAGLEKDLVTIGMLDRIEIWAKSVYDSDPNGGQLSADVLSEISEKYQV